MRHLHLISLVLTNPWQMPFRIFAELVVLEDDVGHSAREELTRRVGLFSAENWEVLLRSGAQPIPLVLGLLERNKLKFDFGEPLSQALHAVVYNAIDGQSFDADLIRGWFSLSKLLDSFARGIFLKGVRDRIVSTTQPGALQVLLGGGASLLNEGQFEAKGDEAIRNMLNPLLDKQPDGINWVIENVSVIEPIVRAGEEGTRTYIATKLDGFTKGADAALVSAGSMLLEKWGLNHLVPSTGSEGGGEAETDENEDAGSNKA